ncbi:MAG: bifunctional (p)ppGpp synthetase/guanosine-3',5'-bis(diphosphate) 3'-pyrophosphohydrolase [Clostridia bacterium]|nr:bifunctional (p)ppGpp synthetase/guanosine-3',5'-bis(diphosphate) 3'-pyrophosphohydrolase [Clostridia bacterium]
MKKTQETRSVELHDQFNERDFTDNVVEAYQSYDELVHTISLSGKDYDMAAIEKAYLFANRAHAGQTRKSGEPYIVHPISVANILVQLGMDTDSVVAALLHDVVEDTPVTSAEIEANFGSIIAQIIDGLTKLSKMGFKTREEHQAENVRRMLIASNKDIRVLIIKLADRLNNMRTLSAMYPQKQRDIARETMEIYAPLAHRLGIRQVKEELEDLSLRYLEPDVYKEICDMLSEQQSDREAFLESIKQELYGKLVQMIPNVTMSGRVKSVNGIYHKMIVQGKSFKDIYDIYAVRVIVDTVAECYAALGVVNNTYTFLPTRFKDYISTPKSNGYMSLHTTVMRKSSDPNAVAVPFEVQIRTRDMHRTAEYGIAAHWKYKTGEAASGGGSSALLFERSIVWIREMIESQMDSDSADVITLIKNDLMPDEIYVYTPKGEVKVLPSGSTVIDFAYAIHSQVGHRMIGAKLNGRIVPINTVLHTGNVVEIQTTKEIVNGPSRDWLNMARTSQAKSKIRSWFKNERRAENIVEGRAEFEREMKRAGLTIPEDKFDEFMQEQMRRAHVETVEDFYAAIGFGGIVMTRIMPRIREDYDRIVVKPQQPVTVPPPEQRHNTEGGDFGVCVEGVEHCQIKMSQCCHPLPGDEIIGFITRGYGVSVHKRSCSNVPADISACEHPERWIPVYWTGESTCREFKTTLHISCLDRKGLLADITTQLSMMHIGIHMLNSRELKDGGAVITATITVSSREHLAQIVGKLSRISGVVSID